MKPLIAAAYVESGGSMDDVVEASEGEYPTGDFPEAEDSPFDDREWRFSFSQATRPGDQANRDNDDG